MTVTKSRLAEVLREKHGLGKGLSRDLISSVFDTIKETLETGEDVLISGFGKLCVKDRKPRLGRNPRTGEDLMLEARRVVTFKCSSVLKNKLNGNG
jgi:integration host factor subunit alpha